MDRVRKSEEVLMSAVVAYEGAYHASQVLEHDDEVYPTDWT